MSSMLVWLRVLPVASVLALAATAADGAPVVPTPALSVPGSLVFGNVLVGRSRTLALTVANTGGAGTGANACTSATRLCVTFGGAIDDVGDEFTPNASSAQTAPLGPSGPNGKAARTYVYAPTGRHGDGATVAITTNNAARDGGPKTVALSGNGVAPVNQVQVTNAAATRVGTTGQAAVSVTNIGDGNLSGLGAVSNLKGTVGGPVGDAAFSGPGPDGVVDLGDGAAKVFQFEFAPNARGDFAADVAANFTNGKGDGSNLAEVVLASLAGQGVGPVFGASVAPDDFIDFGLIAPGTTTTFDLVIENITADLDFDVALNGLTLLDVAFSGPNAEWFSIAGGFAPVVLDPDGAASVTLQVQYAAPSVFGGFYLGALTILTDQGAAFGTAGQSFVFNLSGGTIEEPSSDIVAGAAVPEPSTYAMIGWMLMASSMFVRRR